MPTAAQLQNIWLLSDTVLYPEAVSFMHRLIRDQECRPLPASQVAGLLSIAEAYKYDELYNFVIHQRDRNWPPRQRDIKTFYTALEETLTNMTKRLRGDFHLLAGGRKLGNQSGPEENELMALLAREFIQHLIAENGLLAAKTENQYTKPPQYTQQKPNRR
jgi:hypothetical protein